MSNRLVLCYHALSATWSADLSVTPQAFERQLTSLATAGWTFTGFSEALRRPPEQRTVAVTFDDAFLSVKTYAAPVLKALGVPATVFVPTDYVSRGAPLAWEGLDHWHSTPDAHELTPMSWDDLGELAEAGWEIGSHTRTHAHLTTLDEETLTTELGQSREECAARTGRLTTSVAYPYGDVDERVVASARRTGYEAAAALEWPSSKSSSLRYPRVGIYHVDSWPRFRLKTGRLSRTRYGSMLLARRG
ncbi:MAG: polysaccharide deacetylase family protein [Solirubrobacteraceae bacterium]